MEKINFYSNINTIIDNSIRADKVKVNHLFFVPERKGNIDGWCDAHRYGYDNINNKCYDLGITEAMPKIDYTEFVFDFVPGGVHIAKKDKTLFNIDCFLYCDTIIN